MVGIEHAVILAGGQGTRLRERLGDLPKPLIDICGVPLLERQILLLKKYGYKRITVLVNYKAEKIEEFCKEHNNWNININCVNDGNPRGTAGAVLQILDTLDEQFLVVYGDTMLEVDLLRFEMFHEQDSSSAGTLFLHPNDHPQDSDLVDMDEQYYIKNFYPSPHRSTIYLPNLVNAALYILRKRPLLCWQHLISEKIIDFGKHLFPLMLQEKQTLRGYNSPEYIKDCGTPERLDKVCQHLLMGKVQKDSLSQLQPTVFLDRDGTLNKEVSYISSADQLELLPNIGKSIRALNQSPYKTCIITNQPVIARGDCTLADLKNIHNKLETLLGMDGAFIDRIYICPHHPDAGFDGEVPSLKIICQCRKPSIGMIARAQRELNTDLGQSWLIGDTTTDIQTAINAGLKSILIETGYSGLDHKFDCRADIILPDLFEAVNFILNVYPEALKRAKQEIEDIQQGDILLIGGQAKSGKSSTASILKIALQSKYEQTIHLIETDNWLPSKLEQKTISKETDITQLKKVFNSVLNRSDSPLIINIPTYIDKNQATLRCSKHIMIQPNDIVIFEGLMALNLMFEQANKVHRFAVLINEKERKKRLIKGYIKLGLSLDDAANFYDTALINEYHFIEESSKNAKPISIL